MTVSIRLSRRLATLLFAGVAPFTSLGAQAAPRHRAILVSFDGFTEQRLRQYADSLTAPHLLSLFSTAACAEASRPSFPSVTPVGHAAIWTGAYGNVSGVAARMNQQLPLSETTILDWTDGYRVPTLRAEPIWISAARQGARVFSHMPTQAPEPPAYQYGDRPSLELTRARERAAATLARPELGVVNVYNEIIAPARALTQSDGTPKAARGWRGLAKLTQGGVSPRELSWAIGNEGDSLHALFYGKGYRSAVIATSRDVSRGTVVHFAPTDTARPRGRALARHFSESLRLDLPRGRRTFVFFRLFETSPDLSRFMLYASEARVVHGNRDVASAYDDAVHGTLGNGATQLLERGALGATRATGGDGMAELRYFETAELVVRQLMRGTEWGWRSYNPDLAIDYTPYPDEHLHTWLGFADPSTPGISADVRAYAASLLARSYELMDIRLEQFQRLAAETPNTLLFVTGEHGMRPAWATFRPNVALLRAGMLAVDSTGRIDLAHTLAASIDGSSIFVNRATRRGGIVPNDSVESVLRRVEQVLRGVRDSTGAQIVTAIWRSASAAGDSLGLGGPTGGDLYYGVAPGLHWGAGTIGPIVSVMPIPKGEHGFPSVDRDMQPALCVTGGATRRFGMVRAIDIAPTISQWLGLDAPADARGTSVLSEIINR